MSQQRAVVQIWLNALPIYVPVLVPPIIHKCINMDFDNNLGKLELFKVKTVI